jgi:hypothetical protein
MIPNYPDIEMFRVIRYHLVIKLSHYKKCWLSLNLDLEVDLVPMLGGNDTQLTADTEVNNLWIEDGRKSSGTRFVI